jgi:hypothetical protein
LPEHYQKYEDYLKIPGEALSISKLGNLLSESAYLKANEWREYGCTRIQKKASFKSKAVNHWYQWVLK